jgi:hypothetical protein
MSFSPNSPITNPNIVDPATFDWDNAIIDYDTNLGVGVTMLHGEVKFGSGNTVVSLASLVLQSEGVQS